jgi:hypothetical protein
LDEKLTERPSPFWALLQQMLMELHWVVESLQVVPPLPSSVGEQQNGDPEEQ